MYVLQLCQIGECMYMYIACHDEQRNIYILTIKAETQFAPPEKTNQ